MGGGDWGHTTFQSVGGQLCICTPPTLLLEKAACLAWKQKLFNKARDTRVLRVFLQSNNLYLIFCLSLVLKLVSHFRSFLEAFPTSTFLDHLQRLPLPFWSTFKACPLLSSLLAKQPPPPTFRSTDPLRLCYR